MMVHAAALIAIGALASAGPPTVVEWGTDGAGKASEAWVDAIEDRHPPGEAARLGAEARPFTAEELAWAALFLTEVPTWAETRRPVLDKPFERHPGRVRVLLGNRGGSDAFTEGESVIALDVSAWQREYGNAGPEQVAGVHRVLDHEYTHLLTRLWRRDQSIVTTTPLDRALWTLFHEGLGNYRSLGDHWKPNAKGQLSPKAKSAWALNTPVFVERIAALAAGPDAATEAKLIEGMTSGPFAEKWGAVTVAQMIAAEVAAGPDEVSVLKRILRDGPAGILPMARRHLSPELAAKLPGGQAPPPLSAPEMELLEAPKIKSGLDAFEPR